MKNESINPAQIIDPNIIGQIVFGLSFPVTKGRSDVRGIRASKSLSKYWLNALEPAEARKVDNAKTNISNQLSKLLGMIKTPETAHKVIVKLILTLKRLTINLKKESIKFYLKCLQSLNCLKQMIIKRLILWL